MGGWHAAPLLTSNVMLYAGVEAICCRVARAYRRGVLPWLSALLMFCCGTHSGTCAASYSPVTRRAQLCIALKSICAAASSALAHVSFCHEALEPLEVHARSSIENWIAEVAAVRLQVLGPLAPSRINGGGR